MKEISIAIPKDEPKLKAAPQEIAKLQKSQRLTSSSRRHEIQEQNTNKTLVERGLRMFDFLGQYWPLFEGSRQTMIISIIGVVVSP
ncbi:hypothetical protein ACW18Z_02490 [Limosilactobacillus fermentum]